MTTYDKIHASIIALAGVASFVYGIHTDDIRREILGVVIMIYAKVTFIPYPLKK